MKTYAPLKGFAENPDFQIQKAAALRSLTDEIIDPPIVGLIRRLNQLSCIFTLQSCFGHFLHSGQSDSHNLEPLPSTGIVSGVDYRIAYMAFCLQNSPEGKSLFEAFSDIPSIDPENIQFCCAEWFWRKQVNSYALQVEPDRFRDRDRVRVDYEEASHLETTRNKFFDKLDQSIGNMSAPKASPSRGKSLSGQTEMKRSIKVKL